MEKLFDNKINEEGTMVFKSDFDNLIQKEKYIMFDDKSLDLYKARLFKIGEGNPSLIEEVEELAKAQLNLLEKKIIKNDINGTGDNTIIYIAKASDFDFFNKKKEKDPIDKKKGIKKEGESERDDDNMEDFTSKNDQEEDKDLTYKELEEKSREELEQIIQDKGLKIDPQEFPDDESLRDKLAEMLGIEDKDNDENEDDKDGNGKNDLEEQDEDAEDKNPFNDATKDEEKEANEEGKENEEDESSTEDNGESFTPEDLKLMDRPTLEKLIEEEKINVDPAQFEDDDALREAISAQLGGENDETEENTEAEDNQEEETIEDKEPDEHENDFNHHKMMAGYHEMQSKNHDKEIPGLSKFKDEKTQQLVKTKQEASGLHKELATHHASKKDELYDGKIHGGWEENVPSEDEINQYVSGDKDEAQHFKPGQASELIGHLSETSTGDLKAFMQDPASNPELVKMAKQELMKRGQFKEEEDNTKGLKPNPQLDNKGGQIKKSVEDALNLLIKK